MGAEYASLPPLIKVALEVIAAPFAALTKCNPSESQLPSLEEGYIMTRISAAERQGSMVSELYMLDDPSDTRHANAPSQQQGVCSEMVADFTPDRKIRA